MAPMIMSTTEATMATMSGVWKLMSAAAVARSSPSMVAKYQIGTAMVTTRLTQVIFSSNGMTASSANAGDVKNV